MFFGTCVKWSHAQRDFGPPAARTAIAGAWTPRAEMGRAPVASSSCESGAVRGRKRVRKKERRGWRGGGGSVIFTPTPGSGYQLALACTFSSLSSFSPFFFWTLSSIRCRSGAHPHALQLRFCLGLLLTHNYCFCAVGSNCSYWGDWWEASDFWWVWDYLPSFYSGPLKKSFVNSPV